MARLLQGGKPVLNLEGGNVLLAHLQTAAYQRFQRGQGFFITFFGGTDDSGDPIPTNSLWCPVGVSLHFYYDDYDEPVEVKQDLVDILLKAMEDPLGVIVGPGGDVEWPFTLLATERGSPHK